MYAPPIRSSPTDGRTDSFSPFLLFSSRNLFILENLNCHRPLWDCTGSSIQTSSMTLTHLPFYIAPLAVAPPLTSPLLPPLLPCLASGRCFRTWILFTYQFFHLSPSLRSFAPTSAPLLSIFRKLAGKTLLLTLTFSVLQQRNTRLFLLPLLLSSFLP